MLNILSENIVDTHFNYILIGSGFGSAFFLHVSYSPKIGQ